MKKNDSSCINRVGENLKCPSCNGFSIKYGVSSAKKQRYFCKSCCKTFVHFYTRQSYCTAGIRSIVNTYANDSMLSAFFDTWPGGLTAFNAAVTPEYKLTTVYDADPAAAITEMAKEASAAELEDIITDERDIPLPEFGEKLIGAGGLAGDVNESLRYGSSGDTISLAEHHLYGSSRLGVQRYDSTALANITWLPPEEAAHLRLTLKKRVPWYSYSFTDLIDSTKKSPYGDVVEPNNTYTGDLKSYRILARRYYELTDHLGNVLATVLDRKTGAGESPTAYNKNSENGKAGTVTGSQLTTNLTTAREGNQVVNASVEIKGGTSSIYQLPTEKGIEGQVTMTPLLNEICKNVKTNELKSRPSLVFHELWENYYRTTKHQKYNPAHKSSIVEEKKLHWSDPRRSYGSEGEGGTIYQADPAPSKSKKED